MKKKFIEAMEAIPFLITDTEFLRRYFATDNLFALLCVGVGLYATWWQISRRDGRAACRQKGKT